MCTGLQSTFIHCSGLVRCSNLVYDFDFQDKRPQRNHGISGFPVPREGALLHPSHSGSGIPQELREGTQTLQQYQGRHQLTIQKFKL